MKRLKMILLSICAIANYAHAGFIKIELDNQNLAIGEVVTASLIAELSNPVDTIDLDILFDTGLFSLNTSSVISNLPSDGIDNFFAFEANSTGAGLTFLSFDEVFSGSLLLASFELTALTEGISIFDVQTRDLYNFTLDESYEFSEVIPANANIVTEVPEPSHLALSLFGLILISRLRKNK